MSDSFDAHGAAAGGAAAGGAAAGGGVLYARAAALGAQDDDEQARAHVEGGGGHSPAWRRVAGMAAALLVLGAMAALALWWWGFSDDARERGARRARMAAAVTLDRLDRPFAYSVFAPNVESRAAAGRFARAASLERVSMTIAEAPGCFRLAPPLGQTPDCERLDIAIQGGPAQSLFLAHRQGVGGRVFLDLTPAADDVGQSARMDLALDWLNARGLGRTAPESLLTLYAAACDPLFQARPFCWRRRHGDLALTYGFTALGQPYLALENARSGGCLDKADEELLAEQFPLRSDDPLTACRWLRTAESRFGERFHPVAVARR